MPDLKEVAEIIKHCFDRRDMEEPSKEDISQAAAEIDAYYRRWFLGIIGTNEAEGISADGCLLSIPIMDELIRNAFRAEIRKKVEGK